MHPRCWTMICGLSLALALLTPATLSSPFPYSHGEPSNHEQFMLELVNAARADPAGEAARLGMDLNQGLAPGTISTNSKPPLAFHGSLIKAARSHSDWMLATGSFAHTGVDGTSPSDRAAREGYGFPVAENISYQWTNRSPDQSLMTRTMHEDLVRSVAHRENVMNPGSSVVGVGLREGSFQGRNMTFMATQKFSAGGDTPDSGPFLVGVVYADRNGNGAYDPGEGFGSVRVGNSFNANYARTSASGGYAIPVLPVETNTATVPVPLALQHAAWEAVKPYEDAFRAEQISAAPPMVGEIVWSGGALRDPVTNNITIARPVRINYRLQGTDGWTYGDRTMVTAVSTKADLAVPSAGLLPSAKILPPKRTVKAGRKLKLMVLVANDLLTDEAVTVSFEWRNRSDLPIPVLEPFVAKGKRKTTHRPKVTRRSFSILIPGDKGGAAELAASVGSADPGQPCFILIKPSK